MYIIYILLIVLVLLLYVIIKNKSTYKEKVTKPITISVKGKEKTVYFDDFKLLKPIEFQVILKSSGCDPVTQTYKGILLKDIILDNFSPDSLENATKVFVKSFDGYKVSLALEELLDPDNVYLCYERDGVPILSELDKKSCYQMVIRKDKFGKNWCKYVKEVIIQ